MKSTPPKCKICENVVKTWNSNKKSWATYCSKKCRAQDPQLSNISFEKRKNTCMTVYGVDNPRKSIQIQQKIKDTWSEKYGVDNPQKHLSIKQKTIHSLISKTDTEKFTINQQRKLTNLDRYGVEHPTLNKKILDKSRKTKLEKYGDENYTNQPKREQTKLEKYNDKNYVNTDKIKQTNLEIYGVAYPLQNQTILQKSKTTKLEKYGVEYSLQHLDTREKIKNSWKQKYGVEYPTQNTEIREKIKQTNLERYGHENAFNNKEVQEKQKQTNIDKYGVSNYNQQHMIDISPLIEDYDWLFDQYIIQNKSAVHLANELGIGDTTIGRYLKKAEISIKKYHQSFISKLWLTQIQEHEGIELVYEYQWDSNNLRTKADGYCQETNTIYEFHGDYWHGNPSIYASDIIHPIIKKTMGELYQKTIQREERIKSLGYNLVVMWESAFNKYTTK